MFLSQILLLLGVAMTVCLLVVGYSDVPRKCPITGR